MGKDTKSDSGLPPEVDANKTHLVKGATLNMLIKALRRTKPIGGRGVSVRQTDDGWVIDASVAESADTTHPWQLFVPTDGTLIGFRPAYVEDPLLADTPEPRLEGGALSLEPLYEITTAGTYYVYLKLTFVVETSDIGTDTSFYVATDMRLDAEPDQDTTPCLEVVVTTSAESDDPPVVNRSTGEVAGGIFYALITRFEAVAAGDGFTITELAGQPTMTMNQRILHFNVPYIVLCPI